ncbi:MULTISPECIES: cysteine-rich CWC family protein [unclassified Pseudomonas]|uniref:cysteine-rich CWC family protein n=1 Tax=unclassified Pseudomonas TaxID=196821 RepID=UPI002ACB0757|nr:MULTISPECIES: cysteine-rich CWC family protein [unclassified Pseudomonas]MEB0039655.1 cysteine-rich CWC family protein [Pseudomonas sp. MH10]MEB0093605.1 cysteine-rich CWC family protein [Pseudomonas sp. CCI4.2]MEB0121697.1 cysteine-rich CWC family protein [Pseudomonas sp. CCI1.2]WPX56086.1 cysteine-rich CWC family protein [Pseudomonas sp. CCI4.2]WPX63599.1 cysteine-rich CWC family protein [Pseudomonas sp. MH10]
MLNEPDPIDSSTCPVCGLSNSCTLADPRTAAQPCWCFSVDIDPALFEALPLNTRNQACLCPRCARAEIDVTSKSDH